MTTIANQLRQTVWNKFSESTPESLHKLKTFALTEDTKTLASDINFSLFNSEHIEKARQIWESFFALADNFEKNEVEAVQDAVHAFQSLGNTVNPEMLSYAFMVFVTHNERAKRVLNGAIPSIFIREPEKILPSSGMFLSMPGFEKQATAYTGGTTSEEENKLSWFREDPLLNEHHEHWHVVYPNGGIDNKAKDRSGELFVYMHQQMIARYDAERLAEGIEHVQPYYDFNKPVEVGYNPGQFTQVFGDMRYSSRPANWQIKSLDYIKISQQMDFQQKLNEAVEKGYLEANNSKIKLDSNLLGLILESAGGNVEKFKAIKAVYGNVHNMGHMLICNAGNDQPYGVMSATATAIRDSIFWRWHKNIDDFSYNWQQKQRVNDFSDAPPVLLRKGYDWSPDIILCDLEQISKESITSGKDYETLGQELFGGDKWEQDFTDTTLTGLSTQMKTGTIKIKNQDHSISQVDYQYLNHQKFCYFIRLQNLSPIHTKVTVRVFLAPKAEAENRRMWIELDKFVKELDGDSKTVVFRRDADSSVIKKPAITNPDLENIDYKPLSVDYRGLLSGSIDDFIAGLSNLINKDDDDDPINAPDLLDYHQVLLKAKSDYTSGNIDEAAYKKEEAGFSSILSKYMSNISIAWQEMEHLNFPKDLAELKSKVDAGYIQSKAAEQLPDIEFYFNAVTIFIKNYQELLEQANQKMNKELTTAFNIAIEKAYNASYCDCGLPYNLLLPRGTAAGMDFYLMVMVTDWKTDHVGEESCCGSMSYCGTKDKYPDIREMGYPFDRPFPNGVLNTISSQPNMACKTIKIISQ